MHIFNQEISMKKSVAFLSFAAIAINRLLKYLLVVLGWKKATA